MDQGNGSNAGDPSSPHAGKAEALLDALETDAGYGLSGDGAARRKQRHGRNELPQRGRAGIVRIVARQFTDPLIYILLIAAGVSLATGNSANAVFISVVLVVNASVGAFQEWQAESGAQSLEQVVRVRPRVLRGGEECQIEATDLVPGDILLLKSGDAIPADLRLLEATNLQADESLLTGESSAVAKGPADDLDANTPLAGRSNLLHSGTAVISGRAKGVVARTGAGTEVGGIAESLASAQTGTPPLVLRLRRLTRWIAALTLAAIVVLALIQLLQGRDWSEIVQLAVALAVAAIPAGLPVSITVALSVAAARMAERSVIVRRLAAVEGLGACTVVASDKTGTLTANELSIQRVWLGPDREVAIGGEPRSPAGEATFDGRPLGDDDREALARLAVAGVLANEAELRVEDGQVTHAAGDATDLAFLVLAEKLGLNRARTPGAYRERERIPFEPAARFSAAFHERDGQLLAHAKGAPETVFAMCALEDIDQVRAQASALAGQGYRLLAVAGGEVESTQREALQGLRLFGIVAVIDPVRDAVPSAIERCRAASVRVCMVTGDHPDTGFAIASQLGIAHAPDEVLTGEALQDDTSGADRIAQARVFARVEPLDKTRIVDGLQDCGEFVAVTGDGVNDAPALDRANIGVAMGQGGTDVARSTADLILTDDNFASIVTGIEQGRMAYDNIRKVVWLLLSTGAAEVLLFFLAIGAGLPIPLTAVQLLWLNVVTNGIQDVALAFEKAEPRILERPPRPPDEPIFNRTMVEQVLVSGAYIGVLAFAVFFYLYSGLGMSEADARNLTLLLLVLFENIHLLSVRSERRSALAVPLRNNPLLIGALVAAQGIHILAMYVPGLNAVLEIRPVPWTTWAALLALAATLLAIDEIAKRVRRSASVEPA